MSQQSHTEMENTDAHNMDSNMGSDSDSQASDNHNRSGTSLTPPKPTKKLKRMCRFRDSWKTTYAYINSVTGNVHRAHCALCRREFGIGHAGKNTSPKNFSPATGFRPNNKNVPEWEKWNVVTLT